MNPQITVTNFEPIEPEPADEIQERRLAAQRICRAPEGYKVCLGCESIVNSTALICSICNTYRFEERKEYVMAFARRNGARSRQTPTLSDLTA